MLEILKKALQWWEDDCRYLTCGEYDDINVFDEPPQWVREAEKAVKWKNIPVANVNTATMEEIDSIPAGDNPFRHDLDRCGVGIGYENEYVAMFHPSFMDEIIIVNRRNGRRYKLNFQR